MSVAAKLAAIPRYRLTVLAVFALTAAGTAASLFAQYVLGMDPCVMCIQQRLGMLFTALAALFCLLLPAAKVWGRTLAALLMSAPAAFGLYIAAKQIHLQSLPPELQPSCGAPWPFRLRNWPMLEWYEPLIRGTGVCGEVHTVLGVSLPVWSAVFFAAVLLAVWGMWLKCFRQPENA